MIRLWLLAVAVVGCKYDPPSIKPGDGAVDATPDAAPCQALGGTCVTPNLLDDCKVNGEVPKRQTCGWGCVGDPGTARCLAITPAGQLVTTADLDPDGVASLQPLVIDAGATIDSMAGTITGVTAVAGTHFEIRQAPEITVFRFKELSIAAPLRVVGDRAIALVSDGQIAITDAPINALGCTLTQATPGPGGSAGGTANLAGLGTGGGQPGASTCGAGGGGFGGTGGPGGGAGACGGTGGITYEDGLVTLVGGSGGASGQGGGGAGLGGGGGAALQLISNTSIAIDATSSINAGGCGATGSGGGPNDSAGGGGSGGTIVLEAPQIDVAGTLAVNGGAGGGGRTGSATLANNATASRSPATGQPKAGAGGDGGDGAAGAVLAGSPGVTGDKSGGGGGGIGRMLFHTVAAAKLTVVNANLSPALTDNPTTCTAGTATLQ